MRRLFFLRKILPLNSFCTSGPRTFESSCLSLSLITKKLLLNFKHVNYLNCFLFFHKHFSCIYFMDLVLLK